MTDNFEMLVSLGLSRGERGQAAEITSYVVMEKQLRKHASTYTMPFDMFLAETETEKAPSSPTRRKLPKTPV